MTRITALVLFISACAFLTACNQKGSKGGAENFGSGSGRVYDRGGLPEDLGRIAIGNGGDGREDTNRSVTGTPSNHPELSKPASKQEPPANQ